MDDFEQKKVVLYYQYDAPYPVYGDQQVVFYLVCIRLNGMLTGEAGRGQTPQEALEDARRMVPNGIGNRWRLP